MTSKQWVTLLTLIGSVLIFGSWLSDNYLKKFWDGKKREFEKYSVNLSVIIQQQRDAQLYSALFYSKYLEDSTQQYTIENTLYGSLMLGQSIVDVANLIANSEKTSNMKSNERDWFVNRLDTFKRWNDTLQILYKNKKIEELNSFVDSLQKKLDLMYSPEVPELSDYYYGSFTKAEDAETLIFWLYILGSVCLGTAFIINRRMEH